MNSGCKLQLNITAISTFFEERPVVFPESRENLGLRVTRCREICYVFESPSFVWIATVRKSLRLKHHHLHCGASVPQLI